MLIFILKLNELFKNGDVKCGNRTLNKHMITFNFSGAWKQQVAWTIAY